MCSWVWRERMVWAEAEPRETIVKAWSYHGKRRPCPSAKAGCCASISLRAARSSAASGSFINARNRLPTSHRPPATCYPQPIPAFKEVGSFCPPPFPFVCIHDHDDHR